MALKDHIYKIIKEQALKEDEDTNNYGTDFPPLIKLINDKLQTLFDKVGEKNIDKNKLNNKIKYVVNEYDDPDDHSLVIRKLKDLFNSLNDNDELSTYLKNSNKDKKDKDNVGKEYEKFRSMQGGSSKDEKQNDESNEDKDIEEKYGTTHLPLITQIDNYLNNFFMNVNEDDINKDKLINKITKEVRYFGKDYSGVLDYLQDFFDDLNDDPLEYFKKNETKKPKKQKDEIKKDKDKTNKSKKDKDKTNKSKENKNKTTPKKRGRPKSLEPKPEVVKRIPQPHSRPFGSKNKQYKDKLILTHDLNVCDKKTRECVNLNSYFNPLGNSHLVIDQFISKYTNDYKQVVKMITHSSDGKLKVIFNSDKNIIQIFLGQDKFDIPFDKYQNYANVFLNKLWHEIYLNAKKENDYQNKILSNSQEDNLTNNNKLNLLYLFVSYIEFKILSSQSIDIFRSLQEKIRFYENEDDFLKQDNSIFNILLAKYILATSYNEMKQNTNQQDTQNEPQHKNDDESIKEINTAINKWSEEVIDKFSRVFNKVKSEYDKMSQQYKGSNTPLKIKKLSDDQLQVYSNIIGESVTIDIKDYSKYYKDLIFRIIKNISNESWELLITKYPLKYKDEWPKDITIKHNFIDIVSIILNYLSNGINTTENIDKVVQMLFVLGYEKEHRYKNDNMDINGSTPYSDDEVDEY